MSQDPPSSMPPAPPAPPPTEATGGTQGPRLPWEERDRLGFFDALIDTLKLLVTAPADAFSRIRADGDYVWPLLFGLIFSWVGQVFAQGWGLLLGSAMTSMMGNFGGSDFGDFAAFGATSFLQAVILLIAWPVIFAVIIFIIAGIYHLALMIVGAAADSPTGFEGTFKVVAYSQVTALAGIVPFLGGLVAFVWGIVLAVIGFAAVHRTTQGKALVAVLIPLVLCCVCAIVLAIAFGSAIAAAMAGASGG